MVHVGPEKMATVAVDGEDLGFKARDVETLKSVFIRFALAVTSSFGLKSKLFLLQSYFVIRGFCRRREAHCFCLTIL